MRSGTANRVGLTACLLIMTVRMGRLIAADTVHTLGSAPAPVDNPLKGLVPYAGDVRGTTKTKTCDGR